MHRCIVRYVRRLDCFPLYETSISKIVERYYNFCQLLSLVHHFTCY